MRAMYTRNPVPGYFRISFPTVTVPRGKVDYMSLKVHQKIREHDVAVIRLRSQRLNWFKYFSSGTPVKITYWSSRNKSKKAQFIGYVTHVRLVPTKRDDDLPAYERDIVCVAASRVFRKTDQKTYKNKTPAEIVSEIGQQFGFEVIAQKSDMRRETITQSGQTYWEFMHKLADKVGYVLKAEGTTLMFMPMTEYSRTYLDTAPMLTDFFFSNAAENDEPNVLEVTSLSGDTSLDAARLTDEAVFASINPVTDEVSFAFAKPSTRSRSSFQRFMSSDSASHTKYDAGLLARGAADNGLLAIEASIRALGDVDLSPYRPATLNLRDSNLTGIWLVKEVVHTLTSWTEPEYDCQVTLGTDSIDGISRRRLMRRPSATKNLSQQLLGTSSTGSRLSAYQTGFVIGSSSSSTASWKSR